MNTFFQAVFILPYVLYSVIYSLSFYFSCSIYVLLPDNVLPIHIFCEPMCSVGSFCSTFCNFLYTLDIFLLAVDILISHVDVVKICTISAETDRNVRNSINASLPNAKLYWKKTDCIFCFVKCLVPKIYSKVFPFFILPRQSYLVNKCRY